MLTHPVPQPILGQLGEMTVVFALLESELQAFLGSLLREHQAVGQIVSSYLTFANLRAAVLSLYRERHGEDADFTTLQDLVKAAASAEDERNRLVHSIWAAGSSGGSVTRVKITAREKHGYRATFEEYDEGRLKGFVSGTKDRVEKLMRFRTKLLASGKLFNNPVAKLW